MAVLLRLAVQNYRCLRDVDFEPTAINVFFGPNGVGKTTFLDALWFVRDCAIRGTEEAASVRHHGIGALTDGADPDLDRIQIGIETPSADYRVKFGYSSGRIEPFAGELLLSKSRGISLVYRPTGSDHAELYNEQLGKSVRRKLPDPEKPALNYFTALAEAESEATELVALLKSLHLYSSRSVSLYQLRRLGSESGVHTYPLDRWQNLWSALRNLSARRAIDDRYETIIRYMRQAFPGSFKDLVLEQLGVDRVGGSLVFVDDDSARLAEESHQFMHILQIVDTETSRFGDQKAKVRVLDTFQHRASTAGRAVNENQGFILGQIMP